MTHCIQCKKEAIQKKDSARNTTPRGWKRIGEATYCDVCWNKKYYLKAISIPILKPLWAWCWLAGIQKIDQRGLG